MRDLRQAGAWGLGPLADVAAVVYTWTNISQVTEIKKPQGTKNNCVHAQLGQIMDNEIGKKKKKKGSKATSEKKTFYYTLISSKIILSFSPSSMTILQPTCGKVFPLSCTTNMCTFEDFGNMRPSNIQITFLEQ